MIYPISDSVILVEANEQISLDPDDLETFADNNKSLLKYMLIGISTSASSKFVSFAVKDFYQGLVGKSITDTGQKLREKLISLYEKLIGRHVKKFGEIITKSIKSAYRYFKDRPKAFVGFILMIVGLVFIAVSRTQVKLDTSKVTNPMYVKKYAAILGKQFNTLFNTKIGKVGLVLFTLGAVLFLWGLV